MPLHALLTGTHARTPPPLQVRRVAPGEAVTTLRRRVAAVAVLCAGSLVVSTSTSSPASSAAAPPRVLPVGHVLGAAELFFPNQGCEVRAPLTHAESPVAPVLCAGRVRPLGANQAWWR